MTRPSAWRAFRRALGDPFRMPLSAWLAAVPLLAAFAFQAFTITTMDVSWLLGDSPSLTVVLLTMAAIGPAVEVLLTAFPSLVAVLAMTRLTGLAPGETRELLLPVAATGGMGLFLYLIVIYAIIAFANLLPRDFLMGAMVVRVAVDCVALGIWAAALSAASARRIVNPFNGPRAILSRPFPAIAFILFVIVFSWATGAPLMFSEALVEIGWSAAAAGAAFMGATKVYAVLLTVAFVARIYSRDPLAEDAAEVFE